MPEITLSNSKGLDAQVMAESVRISSRVRWLDTEDRQASSVRILKGTIDRDYAALASKFGDAEQVAAALIAGDPEIDLESVGSFLRDTSRVYVNSDRQIVYGVTQVEIVRSPDGTEKLRRPKKIPFANVTPERPLLWSGKLMPKLEAFRKFVMVAKLQIVHVNGLTYDFLYEMARDLERQNGLLLMGAGPHANQPLIFRRGSLPCHGFLEGRTRGDDYCLLLHLSNIELKAPAARTTMRGRRS
jgi:hypothetical protein